MCVGAIVMLVTCKKCGIKFQTDQCGMVSCPDCGNQQYVVNCDKPNKTAVSSTEKYVYHSASYDDNTANSASRVLLGFAIVLVVLTALRFIASLLSFDDFSVIRAEIENINHSLSDTYLSSSAKDQLSFYKSALKKFLSMSYAETFMHIIMCACAISVLVYTIKAREYKFPLNQWQLIIFDYYKKSMVFSIIMLIFAVIYAIVESRVIKSGEIVGAIIDTVVMSKGLIVGVWIGVVAIMISCIICIVMSHNLYRSEKQKIK